MCHDFAEGRGNAKHTTSIQRAYVGGWEHKYGRTREGDVMASYGTIDGASGILMALFHQTITNAL